MEDHKVKRPTKKQAMQNVVDYTEKTIKDNYIKALIQGFEVANNMIMEYCEGHTVDEIKAFCKKNVEKKEVVEKIVKGDKDVD